MGCWFNHAWRSADDLLKDLHLERSAKAFRKDYGDPREFKICIMCGKIVKDPTFAKDQEVPITAPPRSSEPEYRHTRQLELLKIKDVCPRCGGPHPEPGAFPGCWSA